MTIKLIMRFILLHVLGLAVLMALVLAVWGAAQGYQASPHLSLGGSKTSITGDQPAGELVATEMKDIPIYPNAQDVGKGCHEVHLDGCSYSMRTYDTFQQVMSFYKGYLAANGWVVTEEIGGEDERRMQFVWTNSQGDAPARRWLFVAIDASPNAEGTEIGLTFHRWPDPNKVPVYPGVHDVQVEWLPNPMFTFPDRVITYLTAASPDEVEAYYKDIMLQHGWWLTAFGAPDLSFGYGRGGNHNHTGSSVIVKIEPIPGGETKVELHVRGTELELQAQRTQK